MLVGFACIELFEEHAGLGCLGAGEPFEDGEGIAPASACTGTFTGGPFQGILPTGRRAEIRGADVMEISGGLIQHNTIYYDGAAFARQIGMLPSRGSRADRALLAALNAKSRLTQRYRDSRHPRLSSLFAADNYPYGAARLHHVRAYAGRRGYQGIFVTLTAEQSRLWSGQTVSQPYIYTSPHLE